MRWTPWLLCVWPGLPQLWQRGAWGGLALAGGWALLLNLALTGSLVWTEWLSGIVLGLAWVAVAAVWFGSLAMHVLFGLPAAEHDIDPVRDLYPLALHEYLQGHWFEAEMLLTRLLHESPMDVDAGLLQATLLRHTNRLPESRQRLEELRRFEGAAKWELEIGRELELLSESATDDSSAEQDQPTIAEPSAPNSDDAVTILSRAA